jgi:PPM family protein phosphatase
MPFAALTHVGNRGGENEDAVGWSEPDRLWFVADGMGGHAAGQVASGIVKDVLLRNSSEKNLAALALRAHEAVLAAARSREEWRGMGSTLVAVRIDEGVCEVVWVGDSRAYLSRNGNLTRLTRDHSVAEELRTEGLLSEAEIRSDARANQITRGLGQDSSTPSSSQVPLRRGDRIVLCSDGMHDEVSDSAIAELVGRNAEPNAAAEALLEAALKGGGRDNISVIVVDYDGPTAPAARRMGRARRALIPILIGVVAAVLVILAFWWLVPR